MKKNQLHKQLEKGHSSTMLIVTITFVIAAIIMSITFFLRENNEAFRNQHARTLLGCDVSVLIWGQPSRFSKEQELFLSQLKEEGCAVKIQREPMVPIKMEDGYKVFAFRFTENGPIDDESCVLSTAAANRLGLEKGDWLTLSGLERKLEVVDILPLVSTNIHAKEMGIIEISYQTAVDFMPEDVNYLELNVKITAPSDGNVDDLLKRTQEQFPRKAASPANDLDVQAWGIIDVLAEYQSIFMMMDIIMLLLSVVGIVLATVGILSLIHLKILRLTPSLVLLRVNGMRFRDGVWLSAYDAIRAALITSVVGGAIGFVIYRYLAFRMTGVIPALNLMDSAFWIAIGKTLFTSFCVMLLCNVWGYRKVFRSSIAELRQNRQSARTSAFRRFLGTFAMILLFSFILALLLYSNQSFSSVIMQMGIMLVMLVVLFLFASAVYAVIRLCVTLLSKIKPRLSSVLSLSYRLVLNRKKFTSLIGTSLILSGCIILLLITVISGVPAIYETMWEAEMGFNAVAYPLPDSYGLDVQRFLDQEGFEYSSLYLTQYYLDPPDLEQTQYSNYISVAILDYNPRSKINLRVEPGTFQYTPFLEYDIPVESGASYTFFDDITVKEAGMRSNLNSSGLYTPAPYAVLLSYEDAAQEAQKGYHTFVMNLSVADKERLEALGTEMGFSVTTAQSRAKSIMNGYSNYIELFTLFSILLCLVVVTFVFSLTYSIMLGRHREFMLYRVYGAAQTAIEKIVILENIVTSAIAMIISIVGVVGLIRLILGMLGITATYVIPPLTMLYMMLGGAMFVTLISIFVARIFDFKHVVVVLRSE